MKTLPTLCTALALVSLGAQAQTGPTPSRVKTEPVAVPSTGAGAKAAEAKAVKFTASSGTLLTQPCGAVSELTLTYLPQHAASVGSVISALEQGREVRLLEAQCDKGKAVAGGVDMRSVVSAATSVAAGPQLDRCKLPSSNGKPQGC